MEEKRVSRVNVINQPPLFHFVKTWDDSKEDILAVFKDKLSKTNLIKETFEKKHLIISALEHKKFGFAKAIFDELVKQEADIIAIKGSKKRNLMHIAAFFGATTLLADIYKEYSKKGTYDINEDKDKEGNTPMHLAAMGGQLKTIFALFHLGANALQMNKSEKTPLHFAVLNYVNAPGKEAKTSAPSQNRPLTPEAYEEAFGKLAIIRALIMLCKADVNAQDKDGNTALHYATYFSLQDIVKDLLKVPSVNVSLTNKQGKVASGLIAALGQDIALSDDDKKKGNSHLHMAASDGQLDVILALADLDTRNNQKQKLGGKEITVNMTNKMLQTPLHLAVLHYERTLPHEKAKITKDNKTLPITTEAYIGAFGKLAVIEALIKLSKVDINRKDIDGNTALHIASRKGLTDVVRALLTSPDIDLSLCNLQGKSAEEVASAPEIAELFWMDEKELLEPSIEVPNLNKRVSSFVTKVEENYIDTSTLGPAQKVAIQRTARDVLMEIYGSEIVEVKFLKDGGITVTKDKVPTTYDLKQVILLNKTRTLPETQLQKQ